MVTQSVSTALLLTVLFVAVNAHVISNPDEIMKENTTGVLITDCPEGDAACSWPIKKVEDEGNTGGQQATVCEGGRLYLRCVEPNNSITIISAFYGRLAPGSAICPHDNPDTISCVNPPSEKIIAEECQGKHSCGIKATNEVFGDPCPGTHKYLQVQFKCTKEDKSSPMNVQL